MGLCGPPVSRQRPSSTTTTCKGTASAKIRDGDLAFMHVRYLEWAGQETAGVEIFRFDADGKVVEHWDVLQPVPETANSANTMF